MDDSCLAVLPCCVGSQVWDKCLTEADRKFLAQFLPIRTNPEEAVRSLLTGKNHHFGNPLLSWQVPLLFLPSLATPPDFFCYNKYHRHPLARSVGRCLCMLFCHQP